MIAQPSVFILGAGASEPYGFPLGHELTKQIIERLNPESEGNQQMVQAVIRAAHCRMSNISEFVKDLLESQTESVDAFLEHRPDLVTIGKYAIAAVLQVNERCETLHSCEPKKHWYKYLLRMVNAPFDQFQDNKLSIITYNYDRSLEEFLFRALRVRAKGQHGDDEWARKLRESIPIVHLHGQLGSHPQFAVDGTKVVVPYGDWGKGAFLKLAGDGIRIIHEDFDLDNDPVFQQAYRLLSQAKYVFFIGFGYH